jgi:UPF0042 nucleotide-binding protein
LHLVFARVFDESGREQGIGGFIAVRDQTKGLVVGKREPAMGMRGLPETEIVLDGMDVPADALVGVLDALRRVPDREVRLLVLDATDEVLQRRFTETRRRHPLAVDRPVVDGIAHERAILGPLRDHADVTIDTSDLAMPDFRRIVQGHFRLGAARGLSVFVQSFSFKLGLPREADLVFDVRFLRNPHYDPVLRPMTGRDAPVADYVAADPDFEGFWTRLTALIGPLLPRYAQEGKSYLTIAVGCTGGRHRSVYTTERLGAWLRATGIDVGVAHRDLERHGVRPG